MKVEMNDISRNYTTNVNVDSSRRMPEENKAIKETAKPKQTAEEEKVKVKEIVDKMNKELETIDTSIEFKVHESDGIGLNKISIKVVEKNSDKVIVEIPSEESIEFAEKMEAITGLLFDHSR